MRRAQGRRGLWGLRESLRRDSGARPPGVQGGSDGGWRYAMLNWYRTKSGLGTDRRVLHRIGSANMNATSWKKYIAGLAVYGTCIVLAALPIYPKPLTQLALSQLLSAAAIASALVAALRMSGLDERLGDRGAYFTQALLGIGVCSGVYGLVSTDPRPDIAFLGYLLWTAVGLMNFSPRRVLALYLANLAIYLNTFSDLLFVTADRERYADAMFSLLMTTLMAAFMSWRAAEYTRARKEKARLRDENAQQLEQLQEAEG